MHGTHIKTIVIVFAVVDTIDEAVHLANETEYSLVASLWTRDINVALDVAGRIRAGETSYGLLLRRFIDIYQVALTSMGQPFTPSLPLASLALGKFNASAAPFRKSDSYAKQWGHGVRPLRR